MYLTNNSFKGKGGGEIVNKEGMRMARNVLEILSWTCLLYTIGYNGILYLNHYEW